MTASRHRARCHRDDPAASVSRATARRRSGRQPLPPRIVRRRCRGRAVVHGAEMDAMATDVAMPVQRDVPVRRGDADAAPSETPPPIPDADAGRAVLEVGLRSADERHGRSPGLLLERQHGEAPKLPAPRPTSSRRGPHRRRRPGIAPVSASQAPHAREPRRSKPPSNITDRRNDRRARRRGPSRTWTVRPRWRIARRVAPRRR